MTSPRFDGQAAATGDRYRALLAVSEAIASHRDVSALFHDLAGRLHQVVRFDFLALVLHEAATNTMRLHVLETCEPVPPGTVIVLPTEEDPAGLVWQTQQPVITSSIAELSLWPRLLERVKPYGVQSNCWLPLTTARRRLGTLVLTSKQPSTYDTTDVGFLQQVANQVAVAVENVLAFQEIEELKDKLAKENAYLEEEARTEHNFGEVVGESAALRRVLKQVETVAPTSSTVLIRGETGTGKELIARALHGLSRRQGRTFVKLNCAAMPTGLLESELFGHEKGAFTGAISQAILRRLGRKLGLWIFGFVVLVKSLQMLMSIFNGRTTLRSADGIPIDAYPPGAGQTVVSLFALLAFTYLMICVICWVVLLRYRSAVPMMFMLLLLDYVSRRAILHFLPVGRTGAPAGVMVNLVLFAVMIVGFVLAIWPMKET